MPEPEPDPSQADTTGGPSAPIPSPSRRSSMSETNTNDLARLKEETIRRRQLIKELRKQLEEVTRERDEIAAGYEALEKEYESAVVDADEAVKELQAERDEWKQKYEEAPSEHFEELKKLRLEKSEQAHDAAIRKVADELGIDPRFHNDLRTLAGYQVGDASPDEAQIKELLTKTVESREWLKKAPEVEQKDAAQKGQASVTDVAKGSAAAPPPRGVAANRGGSPAGDQTGMLRLTAAQVADPAFMQANQARIAEASRNGMFSIVD